MPVKLPYNMWSSYHTPDCDFKILSRNNPRYSLFFNLLFCFTFFNGPCMSFFQNDIACTFLLIEKRAFNEAQNELKRHSETSLTIIWGIKTVTLTHEVPRPFLWKGCGRTGGANLLSASLTNNAGSHKNLELQRAHFKSNDAYEKICKDKRQLSEGTLWANFMKW